MMSERALVSDKTNWEALVNKADILSNHSDKAGQIQSSIDD